MKNQGSRFGANVLNSEGQAHPSRIAVRSWQSSPQVAGSGEVIWE